MKSLALSETNEYGTPSRANTDERHFVTVSLGQSPQTKASILPDSPSTIMRTLPTCCIWAQSVRSRSHGATSSHILMDL